MHVPGGPGIRVDTHVATGANIPASYDSMIAKVIADGADRAEALARVRTALAELQIEGVASNAALHSALLDDPAFRDGGIDIHHFETWHTNRERADV